MTTIVKLRPILDRQQWEMCNIIPFITSVGSHVTSSVLHDQYQIVITSATLQWFYDPAIDAWQQLPSGGLAGTFGAGTCGTATVNGPAGTASAGGSSTITTATNVARSVVGYKIRLTAGTGAGQERTITANTVGANAVITVDTPWSVNPDATSQYLLLTGRYYFFVGNSATPGFKYYDLATNTWSAALVVAGLPTVATDAKLRSTPGAVAQFAAGTATSGTASTLVQTGKTWADNQWVNFQVRIIAGTGAGQVRTITANSTGTTITVSPNWAITPGATSQYVIEGNDDFLYLAGNAALAMYRYSISANAWVTLTPAVARVAAPGAGLSLNWVRNDPDPVWANESAIINGRRLYSWRGAGGGGLDYYDIPSNAWMGAVALWGMGETFSTGTVHDNADRGVILTQKDATGRFFALDVASQQVTPRATLFYPQGVAVVGDRMFTVEYADGAVRLQWIYYIASTTNMMFRCLLI